MRYPGKTPVLRGISLEIARGEIVGLVGQSGSGKSTLALAILGLTWPPARHRGRQNYFSGCRPARHARTRTAQSPRTLPESRSSESAGLAQSRAPNSHATKRSLARAQRQQRHGHCQSEDCDHAIQSALKSVSLPNDKDDNSEDFLRKRASQLSVGQAQRVLIAMAVMHRPALLIADEATSALDVITQSEILELFARLNRETGMSILYISHDLPSVAGICHRIAILHEGQIVECGPTEQIFTAPVHAYTQRLMSALPQLPTRRETSLAKAQAATAE